MKVAAVLKKILLYVAAFILTVVMALALLVLGAFLPQEKIQENALESVILVNHDIKDNKLFDRSMASKLDVGTDGMILRTSLSTKSSYLGSVLTNPVYTYQGLSEWDDIGETLARLAYEMPHDNVWYYARYWLGFRGPMRLALTFLNYAQIKRYLAFLFFILFAAAISSVAKNTNAKLAFLFAVSVILVRPHVIATSMQFTCCFIIAFVGMILVPRIHSLKKYEPLFFMELGMITMYFDFYTVPLITYGLPMLYLRLIGTETSQRISIKGLLGDFFAWLSGYGLMWIAKLTLTTLLTDVNALQQGFASFAGRMGIRKVAEVKQFYSIEAALNGVREAVFSDETGMKIYCLCMVFIMCYVLVVCFRRESIWRHIYSGIPFLLLAAMPILWFCATMQPVAIHPYFQYRTIVMTHWGAGIFFYCLTEKRPKPA